MVKFKAKLELDEATFKRFIDKKQKLIVSNIIAVMKNEGIPFLIELIMIGYDSISQRADLGPDDPTNPSLWRQEFEAKLHEDLANTFLFDGKRLTVRLGNREFLGYTPDETADPDDTTPLHWLVFYIEGLLGDWAFITPDVYDRVRGGKYDPRWGRFGQGFMISREEYIREGWDREIPFAQVRHPFSGFSPLDIFDEALREFQIRPFIQKAINASVEGKKL